MNANIGLERKDHVIQLLMTIIDLIKGLDDKEQLETIFLDLSKAFENVSH